MAKNNEFPGETEGDVPRVNSGDPAFGEDIVELYDEIWSADPEDIGTTDHQQDVPGKDVSYEQLRNDVTNPNSWLHTNKGYEQTGYSPADRLSRDNVSSLSLRWQMKNLLPGNRSSPIIVPGDPPVMYFTENNHKIHALNARNGEMYWTATPQFNSNYNDSSNRGAAVVKDKVYISIPGPSIAALDRYTGEEQWSTSLLTDRQEKKMSQPHKRIGVTQAPFIYEGAVWCGQTGDSNGWCAMTALDADNGEVIWQETTVPESEWVGETWKHGSGGPWMTASADPKTNQVFWSVGNANPMFNPNVRPGPNQITESVVAIDAENPKINWERQLYAHELWDYDLDTVPVVFDMKVDGEKRRVVETAPKGGWDWFLDAETGQILERSRPYVRQNHTWSDYYLALPPRGEENKANYFPSDSTEWPSDAYSPKTGLRYIGSNDSPNSIYYDPDWEYGPDQFAANGGGKDDAIPPFTSYGYVSAIEPDSGEVAWRFKLKDIKEDWTEWRAWTGGTTATAGNLVFHASAGGHFYAIDAEKGDQLWADNIGKRLTASPVVWDDPDSSRTFVAIAANNRLNVYASDEM